MNHITLSKTGKSLTLLSQPPVFSMLSGLLFTLLIQLVTLQSLPETFSWIVSHPAPFLLTFIALAGLTFFWHSVTGRRAAAFLLTGLPPLLLALISHYKTVINGFPLLLSDLGFAKNIGEIAGFSMSQLRITPSIAAAAFCFTAAAVLAFFADRKFRKKDSGSRKNIETADTTAVRQQTPETADAATATEQASVTADAVTVTEQAPEAADTVAVAESTDGAVRSGPNSAAAGLRKIPARAVSCGLSFVLILTVFFGTAVYTSAAEAEKDVFQRDRIDQYGFFMGFSAAVAASVRDQQNSGAQYEKLIAQIKKEAGLLAEEMKNAASVRDSLNSGDKNDTQNGNDNTDKNGISGENSGSEETEQPSVILILSESFFDVSRLEGYECSKKDITPAYHRLAEDHTSGRFYSNTYAGGTGNAEIEILTGLSSYFLKEGDSLTTLPEETYSRIPSISRVLSENGYRNIFLHAHTSALYNREVIYRSLGYDEILFSDSFPEDAKRRGGFLSDQAFAEKIISLYEENMERNPDQPIFLSAVSMENHQPYDENKFAVLNDFKVTGDKLSEKNREILNVYMNGLADADASLEMLTDYFSDADRPVMLIFYGDHLPNLGSGDGTLVYSDLGYVPSQYSSDWSGQSMLNILTTDYLIWTNYEEESAPDRNTSTSLLGLDILTRLDLPLTGYYQWIEENVRPDMTAIYSRVYVDGKNRVYDIIPEEKQYSMDRYSAVIYDIIYGNNEIFGS